LGFGFFSDTEFHNLSRSISGEEARRSTEFLLIVKALIVNELIVESLRVNWLRVKSLRVKSWLSE
jgi:hypothetical protein